MLREEIRPKKSAITKSGISVIEAARPVSIKKGNKLEGAAGPDEEAMCNGVFQVPKDALHSNPVNILGVLHKPRTFVDSEGNVKTS